MEKNLKELDELILQFDMARMFFAEEEEEEEEASIVVSLKDITERKEAEEEKEKLLHNITEYAKELNCLYGLSKLVEKPDISLEEIFQGVVNLLPSGWQYPEITCARIVFEDKEFKTDRFKASRWKQSVDIKVHGKEVGVMEVYCLEERPENYEEPFLEEERDLIEAIAERLGRITERKKVEGELWESKVFSDSLIAAMKDGFSVLDNQGIHINVNPAFCQMTGFSREELLGVGPPHPYWPPEEHKEIEKAFQKTLRGEFTEFELTFMRKNGERFPVIVSPSWIKDKQGNIISYFATVKDITGRKKA